MLDRVTIERMDAASRGGPIVVALSGGGDSTALLALLADALGPSRLRAMIVDHALREGSAADAERARLIAERLGVAGEVLTLSWPEGGNRSQQSARVARYGALCAAARECGARVMALGHSADDQAETVLMRASAGSGWRGLAGIAPIASPPVWPEGRGIFLARPLLGARREGLRALLRERDVAWIEDPANANAAYERVRVRAHLAELTGQGFDAMRLVAVAKRLRAVAAQLDEAAAALVANAARCEADAIVVDRRLWEGDVSVRQRALSVLLTAVSGEAREPGADAVERLEARWLEPDFRGGSLGGAQISTKGDALFLSRDPGAIQGRADGKLPLAPLSLENGVETVWDGRLALKASGDGAMVYAEGASGRVEEPAGVRVERRWLLAERVRNILSPGA